MTAQQGNPANRQGRRLILDVRLLGEEAQ